MIRQFGRLTFDPHQRQVRLDDSEVLRVTPKAFDLLAVLLDAAPAVVGKVELHARLWPGTFVSDSTLVGLVKELRRVLDDRDRQSPLIRTSYGVGYAFSGAVHTPPLRRSHAARSSIAVLPFVDLGVDRRDEQFGCGLAEELINALARLPHLRVASRTSAFQFCGNGDIRAIGRALDVEHVLEGGILRSGAQLRITARLIDVDDGCHRWAARYERPAEDVFAVYDDVAGSIVRALEPRLAARAQLAVLDDRRLG